MEKGSPVPKLILMALLVGFLGWLVIQNPGQFSEREYDLLLFVFGFTFGSTVASIILKW